jgi:hypothetical protein
MPPRFKLLSERCPLGRQPSRPQITLQDLQYAEAHYRWRKSWSVKMVNDDHWERARDDVFTAAVYGPPQPIYYPTIEAYRRFELKKQSDAAFAKFWQLRKDHQFFRLVITTRHRDCRAFHVARLEEVRRFIWSCLGPLVRGYVRGLHLDGEKYPHWDCVLAVHAHHLGKPEDGYRKRHQNADIGFLEILQNLDTQIHGVDGPGDIRLWSTRIARNPNHLKRAIDYSLRFPRFTRSPWLQSRGDTWMAEVISSDAYGARLGIKRRRLALIKAPQIAETEEGSSTALKAEKPRQGRPPKSAGASYRRRRHLAARAHATARAGMSPGPDHQQVPPAPGHP